MSRSREAAFELIDENENILKVETMSEGYALALFRKKLQGEGNEDENEVLELLRNLDYMPLVISQAAAYIRQRAPRVTVSRYLKSFRRRVEFDKRKWSLYDLTDEISAF